MSEEKLNDIKKCQFCNCLIGEGYKVKYTELYVCANCWRVLLAVMEDSLPLVMRQVGKKAENAIKDHPLEAYFYQEKDSKKAG